MNRLLGSTMLSGGRALLFVDDSAPAVQGKETEKPTMSKRIALDGAEFIAAMGLYPPVTSREHSQLVVNIAPNDDTPPDLIRLINTDRRWKVSINDHCVTLTQAMDDVGPRFVHGPNMESNPFYRIHLSSAYHGEVLTKLMKKYGEFGKTDCPAKTVVGSDGGVVIMLTVPAERNTRKGAEGFKQPNKSRRVTVPPVDTTTQFELARATQHWTAQADAAIRLLNEYMADDRIILEIDTETKRLTGLVQLGV